MKKELYLAKDGHLNNFGNEYLSEIVLENIEKYLPKRFLKTLYLKI